MRKVVDQAKAEGLEVLEILMSIYNLIRDTYNKQGHGKYTPAPDEQKFIQPKNPRARAMSDDAYGFERRTQQTDVTRRRELASELSESIHIEIVDG
jgi:hypothetical protein